MNWLILVFAGLLTLVWILERVIAVQNERLYELEKIANFWEGRKITVEAVENIFADNCEGENNGKSN